MELEEFEQLFESDLTVYFDTNCLLNLYSYPKKMIQKFIDAFERIECIDVRISPTVKTEFDRNIKSKKKEKKENLKGIKKRIPRSLNEFDSFLESVKRSILQSDADDLKDYNELIPDINKLRINLENLVENQINSMSEEETSENNKFIDNFVSKLFCEENIIEECNYVEKNRNIIDGYVRAKHNIPPGYKDLADKYYKVKKNAKGKTLNTDNIIDYLGDYFIWLDVLKDRSENAKLFVTGDMKDDWWEKPKNSKLIDYKPRRELMSEAEISSEEEIYFIPFDLFVLYIINSNGDFDFDGILKMNWNSSIEENILEYIRNDANLEYDIESKIWDDGSVTMGYKVQDCDIEILDSFITGYDVYGSISEEIDNKSGYVSKKIIYQCNVEYQAEGTFNVWLGLEDEYYDNKNGTFSILNGDCMVEVEVIMLVKEIDETEIFNLNNTKIDIAVISVDYVSINHVNFQIENLHEDFEELSLFD